MSTISAGGHYIEGYAGEYIMPNWAVYERESGFYADVEAYQDDALLWNAPRRPGLDRSIFPSMTPPALQVAEAMQHLGLFSPKGLKATSEIWGSLTRDRPGIPLTQQGSGVLKIEEL